MKVTPSRILAFQRKVMSYYAKSGRTLPFRKTRDPYAILLSEVMLQQTQVERGVRYYERWLARWPTIGDLAKVSRTDVLREWMGLGYNNRAKNLHEAAILIASDFEGDVLAALRSETKIPGIGPYTNAAVRIFSANEDIVTVDTNIRRILIHEFRLSEKVTDRELWEIAKKCLPTGKSRDWHNALMDYGATLLTSRKSGIRPKTKQSAFEGSDRQIRARIIRMLLAKSPLPFSSFAPLCKDKKRLRLIARTLKKDSLITIRGDILFLQ